MVRPVEVSPGVGPDDCVISRGTFVLDDSFLAAQIHGGCERVVCAPDGMDIDNPVHHARRGLHWRRLANEPASSPPLDDSEG